jgi:hypothetical protein
VLAYDESRDGLLAVAVRTEEGGGRAALELWRGRRLLRSIPLPRVAAVLRLELDPSGREAALLLPGPRPHAAVWDAGSGAPLLRPVPATGLAWSPDGAWLAIASGGRILVAGADRSSPAYVLPLAARDVAWR